MEAVRHSSCNARLFDSKWNCVETPADAVADIRVRCWRCGKYHRERSVVTFCLKLPKYMAPQEPRPVFCVNPNCMSRLVDIAQPVTYEENRDNADLSLFCKRCKRITYLKLSGITRVV